MNQIMIELIPICLSPRLADKGVYQLSELRQPRRVTLKEFGRYVALPGEVLIEGVVKKVDFYGRGLDCWYIAVEQ